MPEIISPNTGQPIGTWAPTPEVRIEAVLAGLGRPLDALRSVDVRRDLLGRLAAAILARKDQLAKVIVNEVGKTPSEAADEVDYAASFLQYGVEVCDHDRQRSSRGGDRELHVVAAGPALLIAPYNDPLAGITRKIAPSIAAGCPAVVKPSSLGQLTAEALSSCVEAAGLGEHVHLVNHTDRGVLDRLVRDTRFRVLSFTGSTETGMALAAAAGGSLKRLVLELGGNNPFLVLEGADVARAAVDAAARKIRAAGQACSAENRIYVVPPLFERFRERFLAELSAVSFGRSDTGVRMGPVRTAGAVRTLQGLVEESRVHGAVHELGTPGNTGSAFSFAPTVVESDHVMRDHEAFGPLVALCKASRKEALAIASAERQALACYIYGDVSDEEFAPLRFGSIGLNTTKIQGADVPTGGFGTAGIGREGSMWGLEEYLTTINVRKG